MKHKAEYKESLGSIFSPKNVAVIGASKNFGKWGQLILSNIVAGGFQGGVFPLNPRDKEIFGLKVYKQMEDVPEPVDLVFITTPARLVLSVLEDCGRHGAKGAVIITSGFSEQDDSGKKLEKQMVELCVQNRLAIIGPNTMGIICPYAGLFATGTHTRPRKGSVAFISQSGNLGNQLIYWAEQQGIGISLFVGSGNEAMLSCTDYLEYLEKDPHTGIIVLYLESVDNGPEFIETARRINVKKPIIVLKGGRTDAGRAAAASHTGSMSGENAIFRAACRQAGVLDVRVPTELLDLSAAFSSLPLPKGNRVGIVTLGGGWGVVTADECNERGLRGSEPAVLRLSRESGNTSLRSGAGEIPLIWWEPGIRTLRLLRWRNCSNGRGSMRSSVSVLREEMNWSVNCCSLQRRSIRKRLLIFFPVLKE